MLDASSLAARSAGHHTRKWRIVRARRRTTTQAGALTRARKRHRRRTALAVERQRPTGGRKRQPARLSSAASATYVLAAKLDNKQNHRDRSKGPNGVRHDRGHADQTDHRAAWQLVPAVQTRGCLPRTNDL